MQTKSRPRRFLAVGAVLLAVAALVLGTLYAQDFGTKA